MPGMITSISTRSGCSRLAAAMPSSALPALLTRCPFFSSSVVNTRTSVGESSIMRICAIVVPLFDLIALCSTRDVAPDRAKQLLAGERFGQVLFGPHNAATRLVEQAVFG